jgi:hypothetical protein
MATYPRRNPRPCKAITAPPIMPRFTITGGAFVTGAMDAILSRLGTIFTVEATRSGTFAENTLPSENRNSQLTVENQ